MEKKKIKKKIKKICKLLKKVRNIQIKKQIFYKVKSFYKVIKKKKLKLTIKIKIKQKNLIFLFNNNFKKINI